MRKHIELDLRLFEGGEGGGDAAADVGSGGAVEGTSETSEEGKEPGSAEQKEKTEGQRQKEFADLINGEFKDLYATAIEQASNRTAGEMQKLTDALTEHKQLVDLLAEKYGVKSGAVEDIMKAIDGDDAFYEEAAMKEGITVEQYKNMLKMRMQNRQLMEAQERSEQIRQRDETWKRWDMESEMCRQQFPDFSMESESRNPNFLRLLGAGMDVTSAYKACHFDDIVQDMMARTESETRKGVADTIRSGQGRPLENQLGDNAASTGKLDISKMSYKEMDALIEKAKAGERVEL